MKLKPPAVPVLMALLVLAGASAVVAGVYLLLGMAVALIAGGAAAVTLGLLADA